MSNRVGKAVHDIFAPTRPVPAAPTGAAGVVPSPVRAANEPPYVKATVVLRNDQVAKLDRVTADVRGRSGTAIARAELIRAMVDAVLESGMDLTEATSEEDLRRRIGRRLKP